MENQDILKAFRAESQKLKKSYSSAFADPKSNTYIQKICFDSPRLTYLFSGYTLGRTTHLFGPESNGKSTLATLMAAEFQRKVPLLYPGKQVVIYADFEGTFDPGFASRIGLDCSEDRFLLLQADVAEEAFETIERLIKTGAVCCLILDSDALMPTKAAAEGEIGKASFGAGARFMSDELKRLNILLRKYKCSYIHISQERANLKIGSHLPTTTGGYAIRFAASIRNRITKLDTIMKEGKEVGITIRVRNYKNKGAGCTPFRDAEMDLYWDKGFDFNSEYADLIKELELVTVGGGGNFSSEEFGFKVRGFDNFKSWLLGHPEAFDILKKRVDEQVLQYNKLDAYNTEPDDDPYSELAIEALKGEGEGEGLPDYSDLEQGD
jgi:recombination protein RecA